MSVLSSQQIRALIQSPSPLVSHYVDLSAQLQPNGFDLTLASIAEFTGPGRIGVSNDQRVLAVTRDLEFDAEGNVELAPGVYLARLNETVALPGRIAALARPRSSLLRNGVAVHNAVWDAGYVGRSQVQIVVSNPHGAALARDARIVQMLFLTLDAATENPYAGLYQGEGAADSAGARA